MRKKKRKVTEALLESRDPVGIDTEQLPRSLIALEHSSRESNTGAIDQTITVDDNLSSTMTTLVSP